MSDSPRASGLTPSGDRGIGWAHGGPGTDAALALVTGASSGIGAAYAERLASTGHDLVLVARRAERLDALAGRLEAEEGIATRVLVADLSDADGVRAVEEAIAGEPRLALLVNNAGFSGYMPFAELPADEIDRLVEIHDIVTARLTRAALPAMVAAGTRGGRQHGVAVGLLPVAPPEPLPYRVVYAACKAFVVTFTVLLRHELEGTAFGRWSVAPAWWSRSSTDRTGRARPG